MGGGEGVIEGTMRAKGKKELGWMLGCRYYQGGNGGN